MKEESTQQNTETTTEKPLQWALKQGTIPDHKDYPVLHQFGIPIDNKQTTQLLLLELQKCQEQVQGVLVPGAVKSLRTPKSLHVYVPQGLSRSVQKVLVKTVSDMIQWNSADARQKCATHLSRRLDKDYSDSYLQGTIGERVCFVTIGTQNVFKPLDGDVRRCKPADWPTAHHQLIPLISFW